MHAPSLILQLKVHIILFFFLSLLDLILFFSLKKGLLPKDSQAADVLEGCLYEHRSVLDSLNISAYNLSEVFDCITLLMFIMALFYTLTFIKIDLSS